MCVGDEGRRSGMERKDRVRRRRGEIGEEKIKVKGAYRTSNNEEDTKEKRGRTVKVRTEIPETYRDEIKLGTVT